VLEAALTPSGWVPPGRNWVVWGSELYVAGRERRLPGPMRSPTPGKAATVPLVARN
jgi:hypothetical protein